MKGRTALRSREHTRKKGIIKVSQGSKSSEVPYVPVYLNPLVHKLFIRKMPCFNCFIYFPEPLYFRCWVRSDLMPPSSCVSGVQLSGNVWQKRLQMIFSCGHVSEVIRSGFRMKLIPDRYWFLWCCWVFSLCYWGQWNYAIFVWI